MANPKKYASDLSISSDGYGEYKHMTSNSKNNVVDETAQSQSEPHMV